MRRALLLLGLVACAAPPPAPLVASPPVPPPVPALPRIFEVSVSRSEARHGEQVSWAVSADEGGLTRTGEGGEVAWRAPLRLYPGHPLRILPGMIQPRVVGARPDGVVLTGAHDGSVVAFSGEGRPLFQVGVRGAVLRITARPDGDFTVETREGEAVLGADGAVRSDTTVAPHAEERSLAYRARWALRVDGSPFPNVESILSPARDELWVLAGAMWEGLSTGLPTGLHLYRAQGGRFADLGVPTLRFPTRPAEKGDPVFTPLALARGPRGELLVLGARASWAEKDGWLVTSLAQPSLLERQGEGYAERRDFSSSAARTDTHGPLHARHALSASGKREIACLDDVCLARGIAGPGFTPVKAVTDDTRPAFAGETLWLAGKEGVRRGGVKISDVHAVAIFARGEREVWIAAVDPDTVLRWDGERLTPLPAPPWKSSALWASRTDGERLTSYPLKSAALWASGPDDVWMTGDEGAAHFDGARWSVIAGLEDARQVVGAGRDDVWVGGSQGLFHVTPDPEARPARSGEPAPAPAATASRALTAPIDPALRLTRVVIEVDGGPPLRGALGLAEGPGGLLWIHDGHRVVELDGPRARVLHVTPPLDPLTCGRCLAPTARGEGAILTGDLRSLRAGQVGEALLGLSALSALSRAPSGALWVVSAKGEVATRAPGDAHLLGGLPAGSYADMVARADDDLWFAGGLVDGAEETRARPEGEGSLVRFDGRTFTRHRGPDGALLAVAAPSPGEAWAVGLGGGVIHVKAGAAEAHRLTGGPALRAVAVGAPGEVWIGGDGSTVIRLDAQGARRADPAALGLDAAITAIVPPRAGPGWAVGPSGIWRIRAR